MNTFIPLLYNTLKLTATPKRHMVPIAIIFPVPTPIWVGCISKWGKKARNVPKIFKSSPRHSVFMIPWNYCANLTLTQPDIPTEWTFLKFFDKIWDVGGESKTADFHCSKMPNWHEATNPIHVSFVVFIFRWESKLKVEKLFVISLFIYESSTKKLIMYCVSYYDFILKSLNRKWKNGQRAKFEFDI